MDGVKETDIRWTHDIPSDWDLLKFRMGFSFSKGLNITKDDLVEEGIPVISYGQIHAKDNPGTGIVDSMLRYVPESHLLRNKSCLVQSGDFIIADTSEDYAGVGNTAFVDRNSTLFAGYHSIIAKPILGSMYPKYFAYLFLTDSWRDQIRANVMGVKVFSITQRLLRDTVILIPSIKEQKAIVAYLDRECAKLDAIVETIEQQIGKLELYVQSLISETINRGIHADCQMTESGISWIGMIPKHWAIKKLRYLGTLQNGISKDSASFGSGFPFVSYGDVYNNIELPCSVEGLVESSRADRVAYSVKYGDVFFTRTSETIEEIGIASTCLKTIDNATFAGFLIRFRPMTDELEPIFSKYYFRAEMLRKYFVKEMMIVTRASLGQNLLKNLPVLIPPRTEQIAIGRFLDEKCAQIESVIQDKQKQLEKIRSYKKSLIYEYVTGKKRVKEVQTNAHQS